MSDPELRRDARTRLRRESVRKRELLTRDLSAYRYRGPLGRLLRECKLESEHFQVLALLLHRHLAAEDPGCEGRLILSHVYESSFDVLSGTQLLHETSPLRASGLVLIDEDDEEVADLLQARFMLSTEALLAFREEVLGGVPEDLRRGGSSSFGNQRELLVDLRVLHNLYQLRAERVFNVDRWNRVHSTGMDPARHLTRRINAFWGRIRRKLEVTERAQEFPALRFITEHGLAEEETIIVTHLLFKELYEGNAYADAAELLKLVSYSESDLIRNRRLITRSGTLVASDILQLEAMIENRELTAEVHLADWAVNYLLGPSGQERTIDTDERLDWHLYLKNLTDARTFFRDLESN
ncbi:MAG: hypothetical protein AAF628_26370 [Planctomycetota bacterium]